MTRNDFYRSLREKIGTRADAAKLIGIRPKTVERRELGHTKITDEMIVALEYWILKRKKDWRKDWRVEARFLASPNPEIKKLK